MLPYTACDAGPVVSIERGGVLMHFERCEGGRPGRLDKGDDMALANGENLRGYLRVGEDGLCRLDRRVYTDPEIFELEMKNLWEKVWVYVAHESQIPGPHDFFTAQIGRQPIVVTRNQSGKLAAFINACRHRGAKLCRVSKGNAKLIRCPYHGWVYNSNGDLVSVKEEAMGAYPPSFDKKELGLTPVPRLENYRGFIFASLNAGVEPLKDHLGDATVLIDLLVDQSASGWEVLKGSVSYTYDGNWKLQAENGVDSYHATTVHANFAATVQNRLRSHAEGEKIKAMQLHHDPAQIKSGFFDLGHGHVMMWRDWSNPEDRFNYADRENIARRMGEAKMKWAVGRLRNVLIFPNLLLLDVMSSQIRVFRPVAVDKTEVTSYAFAPVGEDPEQKRLRLRSYEDFFNPSGMATADDLSEFKFSQEGFLGEASRWSDLSRGAGHQVAGPNDHARELGIHPLQSGSWSEDEGLFVGMYRYWMQLLAPGVEAGSRD